MYAEKIKEKPSTPIQKKTMSPGSDSHMHKSSNEASPNYGFAFANNAFSEPLQLHTSSHYYDSDVVQLKGGADDAAKLVASKHGKDPVGLDMTCHHIIPQSYLKSLYLICENYIKNNASDAQFWPIINAQFQAWKQNAAASATASANHRETWMPEDDLPSSACQWMSGNIFVGPLNNSRLDDLGDEFDFGGYREEHPIPQVGRRLTQKERKAGKIDRRARHAGNEKMDNLLSIYNKVKKIITDYDADNCSILPDDMPTLLGAITELANVAKYTGTLHSDPFSKISTANTVVSAVKMPSTESAYNVSDWVNVGTKLIKGMDYEHNVFVKMRNEYLNLLILQNPTPCEKNFIDLFSQRLKPTIMESGFKFAPEMTVAKYTFNLIKDSYDALLTSRKEADPNSESKDKNRFHRKKKGTNNSKKSGRLSRFIMEETEDYDDDF